MATLVNCLALILAMIFLWQIDIDPIDKDLLINEQSQYLTSSYSNKFRKIIKLDQFKEEFLRKEVNDYRENIQKYLIDLKVKKTKSSNMFKNDVVRHDRIRILKQINKEALSKADLDFQ